MKMKYLNVTLLLSSLALSTPTLANERFEVKCDAYSGEYASSQIVSIEVMGNTADPDGITEAIFADGTYASFYNDEVEFDTKMAFYSNNAQNAELCLSNDRKEIVMISTVILPSNK